MSSGVEQPAKAGCGLSGGCRIPDLTTGFISGGFVSGEALLRRLSQKARERLALHLCEDQIDGLGRLLIKFRELFGKVGQRHVQIAAGIVPQGLEQSPALFFGKRQRIDRDAESKHGCRTIASETSLQYQFGVLPQLFESQEFDQPVVVPIQV